jgi:hypothetical protein
MYPLSNHYYVSPVSGEGDSGRWHQVRRERGERGAGFAVIHRHLQWEKGLAGWGEACGRRGLWEFEGPRLSFCSASLSRCVVCFLSCPCTPPLHHPTCTTPHPVCTTPTTALRVSPAFSQPCPPQGGPPTTAPSAPAEHSCRSCTATRRSAPSSAGETEDTLLGTLGRVLGAVVAAGRRPLQT